VFEATQSPGQRLTIGFGLRRLMLYAAVEEIHFSPLWVGGLRLSTILGRTCFISEVSSIAAAVSKAIGSLCRRIASAGKEIGTSRLCPTAGGRWNVW
jgi:hypothetical protein